MKVTVHREANMHRGGHFIQIVVVDDRGAVTEVHTYDLDETTGICAAVAAAVVRRKAESGGR